ncbi:MAG: winged helix-turn-helix domain-containing protein [Myxococcaceae bacterium]
MNGARVLLVEDELDISRLLLTHLEGEGFTVQAAGTGAVGLELARRFRPAVVVLDLMLPDVPGLEVCRKLRAHSELGELGILMLTARGDDEDRLLGFEAGADDYVVKPFNVREVGFRVRALVRRCGEQEIAHAVEDRGTRMAWRSLNVDPDRHRVFIKNSEVSLRPIEFKLLSLLLSQPDRIFTREQLLQDVWGSDADVNERTIDVHVRRTRQRLGEMGVAIETVHGVGYRLRAP